MLESIYVGMTGLLGYSKGLRVIANNTANMNTPGFKSSSIQFADLFYTGGNLEGGITSQGRQQVGFGLNTTGTTLSFKQGEIRQTGNDLDMAIDGQGLFVLQNAEGRITYTRDGEFTFDTNGVLVSRVNKAKVMGLDDGGGLAEINLSGQLVNPGKPTSRIVFSGNLSSTATQQTVSNVQVLDASGASHTLTLQLTNSGSVTTGWTATLLDGTTTVGSGQLVFQDGKLPADGAPVTMTYSPPGQSEQTLTLDFSSNVTSFAAGNLSTLAVSSQDGVAPGAMTGAAFDINGVLTLTYSNGQTSTGARLALARFDSPEAVREVGNNQFEMADKSAWHIGTAGQGSFGKIKSGSVEISNVDLSQEFSDLVVMQRGYQANSQIISTANDMLQQLFSITSK